MKLIEKIVSGVFLLVAVALMVGAVVYTCVPTVKDNIDNALGWNQETTEDVDTDTSANFTFGNDKIEIKIGG